MCIRPQACCVSSILRRCACLAVAAPSRAGDGAVGVLKGQFVVRRKSGLRSQVVRFISVMALERADV